MYNIIFTIEKMIHSDNNIISENKKKYYNFLRAYLSRELTNMTDVLFICFLNPEEL